MAPCLDLLCFANSVGKKCTPLDAEIGLVDLSASNVVDQFTKVLDIRMETGVVVGCGQLDELANIGDCSIKSHILVSDDRLGSCLSLICSSAEVLQDK